jgi:hypothetical protein
VQRRFAASELPAAFAVARDAESDDVTAVDVAVYTAEVAAAAADDASGRAGEEGEGRVQTAAEMERGAEEGDGDGGERGAAVDGADVQPQEDEFEDEFGRGPWEGTAAAGRVAGARPVSGARGEEEDEDDGGEDHAAPAMWGVGGSGNDR